MTAPTLSHACWRKSIRSEGSNACVELAGLRGGQVAVRDSKNPNCGLLAFDQTTWAAFVARIKRGGASCRADADGLS